MVEAAGVELSRQNALNQINSNTYSEIKDLKAAFQTALSKAPEKINKTKLNFDDQLLYLLGKWNKLSEEEKRTISTLIKNMMDD